VGVVDAVSQSHQLPTYVIPIRVMLFNQIYLPLPRPFLDRFLSSNRLGDQIMFFKPNQTRCAIFCREFGANTISMFLYSAGQIGSDTGVESAVLF